MLCWALLESNPVARRYRSGLVTLARSPLPPRHPLTSTTTTEDTPLSAKLIPGDLAYIDLDGLEHAVRILDPAPLQRTADGVPIPCSRTPDDCYRLVVITTGQVYTLHNRWVFATADQVQLGLDL